MRTRYCRDRLRRERPHTSGTHARTKPSFTNPVFSNGLGGLDLAFSNRKFFTP